MTSIQQVIDRIRADLTEAMPEDTVDTIKSGDPSREVKGIVVTFMSTWDVLKQAIALGANFVITHEPTFYNHRDESEWLSDDPLYAAKKKMIDDAGLTIWRYHDGWHMHHPDGITAGFTRQMGWQDFEDKEQQGVYHLPDLTLGELAEQLKRKTGTTLVRAAGAPDITCRNVVLMAGSGGGEWHIMALGKYQADVVICGEAPEWQTPEYARDAVAAGMAKAVLVIGHERSEEAGMGLLAEWLREQFPDVKVAHIPSGEPLRVL